MMMDHKSIYAYCVVICVLAFTEAYVVTPNYPDDNEPDLYITIPAGPNPEAYFKDYTLGAQYVGLLLAGRAEFPWLVDLHSKYEDDQETWAIGNLISFKYVMTTCRGIYRLHGDSVVTIGPTFSVYFCTNYLWENYERYNAINQVIYWLKEGAVAGGKRTSKSTLHHPKCNVYTQAWDIGIVELNDGIPPYYSPVIGYMPLYNHDTDYSKPLLPIDLSNHEHRHMVCYVASFGRSYVNIGNHYARDFKVKYRVYWTEIDHCIRFFKYICHEEWVDPACTKGYDDDAKNQLMCFSSRALQGAVCDHDRGAPLVCDGEVYGLVTRGAKLALCNNRIPLYFLVVKFDSFPEFFTTIDERLQEQNYPRD